MRYQQPQQTTQPSQIPMHQPPVPQTTQPQYVPMPPYAPQGMQHSQPMPVMQPSQPMPVVQPQAVQQSAAPGADSTVPLDKGYRRLAWMYFRDTWQMLLGLTGLLLIVFIAVRLATRGYLWGLVFVLLAAILAELPALSRLPGCIADQTSGHMVARTVFLQGVTVQPPSLLSRLGLSARTRYALTDHQGRQYLLVADKGLVSGFGDLEGMEVDIAFLERSNVMTGIHPVRPAEHLSVMESARERHMRQVFREYLP